MGTRKLRNSKLNPTTGNSNATTGNAEARGSLVSEAFKTGASNRSFEERQSSKRRLQTGEEKVK